MYDQRTRIQNALITLVKDFDFQKVHYDPVSGLALLSEQTVRPAGVQVNEVRSKFALDDKYGRGRVLKRQGWQFQMVLRFHQEVTIDALENYLCRNPLTVPAEENLDQVVIDLSDSVTHHPVQQQSETGTQAMLVFIALPSRI